MLFAGNGNIDRYGMIITFAAGLYHRAVVTGVGMPAYHQHNLINQIVMCNAQYFKTELTRKLEVLVKFSVLYFIYHGVLTALLAAFVG